MPRIIVLLFVLLSTLACLGAGFAFASSAPTTLSTDKNSASAQIQKIFDGLQTVGSAYNGGGSKAASQAVLSNGCNALVSALMSDALLAGSLLSDDGQGVRSGILAAAESKSREIGKSTLNSALGSGCAALTGQGSQGASGLAGSAGQTIMASLVSGGLNMAHSSKLPFLTRLEIEGGSSYGDLFTSVTTIQPLWKDQSEQNHVFTQLSWNKTDHKNTYNVGLAWRHLNDSKDILYGANVFFDHNAEMNHNRMSVGLDMQTSLMGAALNRYIPLSSWKSDDLYYEERAAAGWDVEVHGQVPQLPSWTGYLKGFEWDGSTDGTTNVYGAEASVEYSPVPALTVRAGVKDESRSSPSAEVAMRFNWRFDQPADLQLRPRVSLASVEEHVYDKVRRDNTIRVMKRLKASSYLNVVQSVGANSVVEPAGTSALFVGQRVTMPATVSVANVVGNVARLRFSDGAILTLGQGTQVTVEPDQVTLLSGIAQYTSGSVSRTVNVPGAVIKLLGTDIDVRSDGVTSSVRVRDGEVVVTGTVLGTVTLAAEEMAQSISGVVGTVASGTAAYDAHTDDTSVKLDRVASPEDAQKVAPYPYQAPRIVQDATATGSQVLIGLKFSKPVVASGGPVRLTFVINGHARTASIVSGSGTDDLTFGYTLVNSDVGVSTLTVTGISLNGGTLRGTDGLPAVTTFADTVLSLSGAVVSSDSTPPSGYSVSFTTSPVTSANAASTIFAMAGAEVGTTYHYTITSSGGAGSVTNTGTVTAASQSVSGVNVAGLPDGTLTISLTLTDPSGNVGGATTATVLKDATAPTGYAAAFTTNPVNNSNKTAAAFNITGAEVGASYNYTITSSGGAGSVTGSGAVASATQAVSGIDVSGLPDGTLTVSVTLTDTRGNTGSVATGTVVKDIGAPTGYATAFTTSPVNNGNKTAAAFNITSAEIGTTYNYTITTSGGGGSVTGSGTVASATQSVSGVDVSALADGTLTVSVTLTDAQGNLGAATTATAVKDVAAPAGYAAAFTTSPINNSNKTAAAFNITSAEVGATYNYTITSSGGAGSVTGSGTVASATQAVSGLDVSALPDGTLTVSVTLTDTRGNTGTAATGTVVKDVAAPAGYAAAFGTSPINNGNKTAAAFNITSAEVGTTYNYAITSSGGAGSVSGSGTVASTTQAVSGLDVSALPDGTLTVSVTLTDAQGNTGSVATGTVTKDVVAASGYAAAFTTSPVNNGNKTAAAFNITSAEVGSTYNYTITTSGGAGSVTGSGTVASATQSVTGVDVSALADGVLTVSVTLTDAQNNTGTATTATVVKDVAAPAGYAAAFTTNPVNNGNKAAAAFNITSAEVGATYNYTITTSGGAGSVTGSGTVASATQSVTGVDVSALADGTLTVSVALTDAQGNAGSATTATVTKDVVVPSGYATSFTTNPVNNGNKTAAAFNITSAEVGSTYNYTITTSGGAGSVTGSGTVASATQSVTGVDVSALADGTLTVSVTLTDTQGNTGAAATGIAVKDATVPAGYAAAFTTSPVNNGNKTAAAFNITSAEVGTTYNYAITSSGGGTPVSGSGTVASATQSLTALDVSGLADGTLTVSVTLTDNHGNTGSVATGTVVKDVAAPAGYAAAFTTSPVNNGNKTAAAFNITSAEVGSTYNYTITTSGGAGSVTGSGTVASATQSVSGVDVSALADGTLTVSVTLTDTRGNAGAATTATVAKDVVAPSGYTAAFTTSPVYSGNNTAAAFNISGAEVGATYSYTITTSGGAGSVTGSGTVASATQSVSGVDVSALADGTLTVSVTLTDTTNNAGAATTGTVTKDATAPYIVSVTAPANATYGP